MQWIKFDITLFDKPEIRVIEKMEDGDFCLTTLIRLLCLAGKEENDGIFRFQNGEAVTAKELSYIFDLDESRIENALSVFEKYGIVKIENGAIVLSEWCKSESLHTNLEENREKNRQRQARYRERHKVTLD